MVKALLRNWHLFLNKYQADFVIRKLSSEITLNSFPVIRAHALKSAAVAGSSEIKSTSCPISDSLIFLLSSIIGSGHLLPRQSSWSAILNFT